MLEYDIIAFSKGRNTNFTDAFRFQPELLHGFHNLTQKPMSFVTVTIVTVKRDNCRINVWFMSKYKALDRIKTIDLVEKTRRL